MSDPRLDRLAEIAGPVSRETARQLLAFEAMFQKWAARINLAGPATLSDLWDRHLLDSAQLWPLVGDGRRFVDLGSGGGFPGLVIAILARDRPGASVHLVESNRKKAGFLQAAIGEFGLPAKVFAGRIEEAGRLLDAADIVTARALAPLPDLLGLAAPWLTGSATALFHKGRDYRAELQESAHRWDFDLVEHRSCVDPQGVILEISRLRPTVSTKTDVNS